MEYLTIFTDKKSKALLLALTNTEKHFWGGYSPWKYFWENYIERESRNFTEMNSIFIKTYEYEQVAPINLVKWSD